MNILKKNFLINNNYFETNYLKYFISYNIILFFKLINGYSIRLYYFLR